MIIALLSTQTIFMQSSDGALAKELVCVHSTETLSISDLRVTSPSPPDGMEIVKDNYFVDPGFEDDDGSGGPVEFDIEGTSEIHVEPAYQTEVINGSYSAFVSTQGNSFTAPYIYCSRNFNFAPYAYFDQKLQMDFWYNCKSNPEILSGAQIYLRFQIFSIGIGNIYMFYYLSSNSFPFPASNDSTYYGYYDLRGSLDTLYHFDRNITHDFVSVFPSYSPSGAYLREIYFSTSTIIGASGPTQILFDDVNITNAAAYNFVSDNGDFEDGDRDPWFYMHTETGSADFSTTDYSEGTRSFNLTAASSDIESFCEIQMDNDHYLSWRNGGPKGFYAQQLGDLVISFDWKYTESSGAVQYAYFLIDMANETYEAHVYYVLCDVSDTLSRFTNVTYSSSQIRYLAAENFGVRDTWNQFSIDYYELMQSLNLRDLSDYHYKIYTSTSGSNAKVQLLIDNISVVTYPAADPSFENNINWYSDDPIMTWMGNSYAPDRMNTTTDAYSGNYAAKVSSPVGVSSSYIYRDMYLEVTNNLFTDFMWRIDTLTNYGSNAYTTIRLEIDNARRTVHYVLGRNDAVVFTNSSTNCYYVVQGFNQTGIWTNLFRNVTNDVYTAFSVNDWNITRIIPFTYSTGSDVVSVTFDDLYFVRDVAGPDITNLQIAPLAPEYTDSVEVTAEIVDSTSVYSATLFYRFDSGAWVPLPMSATGDQYSATIPSTVTGTIVDYFISAEDAYEHETLLGSDISPYSYIVGDDTPPSVTITSPAESATIADDFLIEADATDAGSGIDYVEFFDGATSLGTDPTAPYTYLWDTRTVSNGEHEITAIAHDTLGNTNSDSVTIDINNDFDGPVLTNLRLDPDVPIADSPVEVRVEAFDTSGIDHVSLFYRINGSSWVEIDMSLDSGDYTVDIPAVSAPATVEYYVVAYDTYDQVSYLGTEADPYEYELALPSITPTPTPTTPSTTTTESGGITFGVIGIIVIALTFAFINKRRKVA